MRGKMRRYRGTWILLVTPALLVPLLLRAQLPPPQPTQPPPEPVMEPTRTPTQLIAETPQAPLQPATPLEILEQQLGLTKPECGPAPAGWPELLERPAGTRPVALALTQIGPRSAVVAWRGAPWATRHEIVNLAAQESGGMAHCYVEWGLFPESPTELEGATRVPEGTIVTSEPRELATALPPPPPAPPALVAMQDTAYGGCYATTYRFMVVAHYADSAPGHSAYHEIVSFTTGAAPAPPPVGALTARGWTMAVELFWPRRKDALEYRIYRDGVRIADGSTVEKLKTRVELYRGFLLADTTYMDQAPRAGTYRYRVEAVFSKCSYAPGPSGEPVSTSATVSAEAKAPPPRAWCRRRGS